MDKIPYAIYKTETFYELQKDCKKVIWDRLLTHLILSQPEHIQDSA